MKSLARLGGHSVSLPLAADDIVEFHAARLLLLLSICGLQCLWTVLRRSKVGWNKLDRRGTVPLTVGTGR